MKLMKKILFILLVSVLSLPVVQAQQEAAESNIPSVIRDGFVEYQKGGRNQAVNAWQNNYAPRREQNSFANDLRRMLGDYERNYGKMEKAELIMVEDVSRSFKRYYILWGFEDGVLFVRFDLYASNAGLKIVGCVINPDPGAVLPTRVMTINK